MKKQLNRLANRVKYWRKYFYASLPEAARAAGISKSIWWKVESGKCNFSYSTIYKINKALFGNIADPSRSLDGPRSDFY